MGRRRRHVIRRFHRTDGGGVTQGNDDEVSLASTAGAASVGENTYETVAAAISAAAEGTTVKLLANVAEDVTVAADKTVTLDLNGCELTNVSSHTVTNNGTLTITDSSTNKTGTIDNVTHGKAPVENAQDATCTIESANITRSKEAGSSTTDSGGNSYYYIENFGTMTIGAEGAANSAVVVGSEGHFSSLVHNGWYDGTKNTSGKEASMTINAGSFKGGINTIKNDDCGVVVINGGDFQNATQYALQNWNKATVNGGSFESTTKASVYTGAANQKFICGVTIVTGGTFKSAADSDFSLFNNGAAPTVEVSGGVFSKDPSAYVVEGYAAALSSDDGTYVVAKKSGEAAKSDNGNSGSAQTSGNIDVSNSSELAAEAAKAADAVKKLDEVTVPEGSTTTTATIGDSKVQVNAAQAEALNDVKSAAAKDGSSVDVNLVVKADTNVEADKAINDKANGADVIPFKLSVDMVTTVTKSDNTSVTASLPVVETASAIKVTISVDPQSIVNKRVSVARNHNGEVAILSADVNYETGAVTFSTDKFSDYAVLASAEGQSYELSNYTDGTARKTITNSDFNYSDDYAFAGWYTDPQCTQAVASTATSGTVYPKFVLVSDLIKFKGGSLRMDQEASTGTSLRFGYETSVPSGASLESVSWDYSIKGSANVYTRKMTNYVVNDDSVTANIVLTGLVVSDYQTVYSAQETVAYTTADGTQVTAKETSANEKSVVAVANSIKASGYAPTADKEYAEKILAAIQAS